MGNGAAVDCSVQRKVELQYWAALPAIGPMAENKPVAPNFMTVAERSMKLSMHDERQEATGHKQVGAMARAHRTDHVGTRTKRFPVVLVACALGVDAQMEARTYPAFGQRAGKPGHRQPARAPVLGQDYGRRPHRCLQSGSETSRRP